MSESYFTISRNGEGKINEKMSRFLAFACKIKDAAEAKQLIKKYQNDYHDARHVCWAYMLGPSRSEWQLSDNGEPSGTAGKPILGQINSRSLTDVLVIVVRYFGGIKLGTPGLIAAYREAASLALDDAGSEKMYCMKRIRVIFPYVASEGVMRVVKSSEIKVEERVFDTSCFMTLLFKEDDAEEIMGRLSGLDGVSIIEDGND